MIHEFYESIIPEPWTILGLKLRPFSLGHYIVLGRIDSPLICGGESHCQDILTAVYLCSKTYRECVAELDNPEMETNVLRWGLRVGGGDKWQVRYGFRKPNVIDWAEKIAMFMDYMKDGCRMPAMHYKDSDSGEVNIPTPQIVKVTLQVKMGLDDDKIMDRPWSHCLWDFATIKAMDGAVDVVDRDEIGAAAKQAEELFFKLNPSLKRN